MTSQLSFKSSSEHYVSRLKAAAFRHRAVRHPYLMALRSGSLPQHRRAVIDFAEQYSNYSSSFVPFLATLKPQLAQPEHRKIIAENLAEESGHYDEETLVELADAGIPSSDFNEVPHHELFVRFTKAVGAHPREPGFPVRQWQQSMLSLMAQPGGHEGVGALGLGTEFIVPTLYASIEQALRALPELSSYDTTFFALHGPVDERHQSELSAMAVELADSTNGRTRLARGMFEALELRACVWDWLHERATVRVQEATL
jgi:hypothetical protein